MIPTISTKDPTVVERHVQAAYLAIFPGGDLLFVPHMFGLAIDCFTGHYADYQAVDARYHDFEHTLQGTLCMARLLHARHRADAQPLLAEPLFQLGIIGILLHDTGYLKQHEDTAGTGAKYTTTHVDRSAQFAARLLDEKGFSSMDITAVQSMIRCTGVDAKLSEIPFSGPEERIVGHALATADLLGQMAADDYVEKLPILYTEYVEAARYDGREAEFIARCGGAEDLVRDTPKFWSEFVLPKLDRDLSGLYRFLNEPYPDGPNEYVSKIEANMERIRQQLGTPQTGREHQAHLSPSSTLEPTSFGFWVRQPD
jgi:hypothetical protein